MKTSSELLFVSAVCACAVMSCGGKKSMVQGVVTGDHITCRPAELQGRFDCATPLRDYFHTNSDSRIAGVNVIYGEGRDELLVWKTQSESWPKASTLVVDNHECSAASPADADPPCAREIDELVTAKPAQHHYFVAPVYGTPAAPAHPGSLSVLDVHSSATVAGDAGWDSAKTELIRCRLEPGEPYMTDLGEGIAHAQQVGSALPFVSAAPSVCLPKLINYLRDHRNERISGIVALDGVEMQHDAGREMHDAPGTIALMIFVGAAPWPTAESLSATDLPCTDAMCAVHFADARAKLDRSARVLFTTPIADALHEHPSVGRLLTISIAQ